MGNMNPITAAIIRKLEIPEGDAKNGAGVQDPGGLKARRQRDCEPCKMEIAIWLKKNGYPATMDEIMAHLGAAEKWAKDHPNPKTDDFGIRREAMVAPRKRNFFERPKGKHWDKLIK